MRPHSPKPIRQYFNLTPIASIRIKTPGDNVCHKRHGNHDDEEEEKGEENCEMWIDIVGLLNLLLPSPCSG